MDFKPPAPRPPRGAGSALRKQALMGAHRTTAQHIPTVLEDEQAGGSEHGLAEARPEPDAEHCGRRSVQLRDWKDYWDDRKSVEVPG
ncbi:hypothetical protein MNEG_15003, partial [Monoraphidium neglectum]